MLSVSSIGFSQTAVLNEKGDTTICFSVSKAKFLLKQVVARKECDTLLSNCETQLNYCDSINDSNKRIQIVMSEMMKKQREVDSLYIFRIQSLELDVENEKKKVVKQKFYKTISIIAGSITTGFMTYLWITK